jgi:glycosyltransferase involved in cell wall biosynthesis
MASGCAVVTTKTGVHGISAIHGREVMVAKNSEEMAMYASQLLNDLTLRTTIAEKAQRLVSEKFSWDAIFAQMDGILDEMFPPKPIRTDNFESTPEEYSNFRSASGAAST